MEALRGQTLVTTSSSVLVGTPKWYQVTSEFFSTEDRLCAGDVALLILAEAIPAREARPAGLNLQRNFASRPPRRGDRRPRLQRHSPETREVEDITY